MQHIEPKPASLCVKVLVVSVKDREGLGKIPGIDAALVTPCVHLQHDRRLQRKSRNKPRFILWFVQIVKQG